MTNFTIGTIFAYLVNDAAQGGLWLLAKYETVLPYLKITSLVASALLLYATVYAMLAGKYHHFSQDQWLDRLGSKTIVARRMGRIWKLAVADIQDKADKKKWAEALKGAESVLQEGLRIKDYQALSGAARARLAYDAGELTTLSEMREARAVFSRAKDDDPELTHEQAIEGLKNYKKVIRELGLMGGQF